MRPMIKQLQEKPFYFCNNPRTLASVGVRTCIFQIDLGANKVANKRSVYGLYVMYMQLFVIPRSRSRKDKAK